MLTELEALVSDDTSSLIDDEGLARRWGSAAGLLDLAAQHGISQRVMKHCLFASTMNRSHSRSFRSSPTARTRRMWSSSSFGPGSAIRLSCRFVRS